MLIESLVERISSSIDQLGRMLDQLHKLPLNAREKYLQSILKLKDKLLVLKTHARETNFPQTQKQFQQICLALHSLKEDLTAALLPAHTHPLTRSKENRDPNRPLQSRKDHEDALRLIVERDEQVAQLRRELFEKEELIKVTFQELHRHRKEGEQLGEQYRLTKAALSHLEIEYSTLKSVFLRTEEDNIDLQLQDQQRERDFRSTIAELEETRAQLEGAREKIGFFQQLAEVSMGKTRQVEENIRMVEEEAALLNSNYLRRQEESLRLVKQLDHASMTISSKDNIILQQEAEITRLGQQVELLQFQINKLEQFMQQERTINYQERSNHQAEKKQLQQTILTLRASEQELRAELSHLRNTAGSSQQTAQQRSKEVRALTAELQECREKMEEYLMMTLDLQAKQEALQTENQALRKERDMQGQQFEKAQLLSRQLQNDIKVWKERLRAKEEQRVKAVLQAEKCLREVRSLEKEHESAIKSIEGYQREVRECKTSIIHLQEEVKQRESDLSVVRGRLLRAKIEIIHEMRQQMG